jgi:hypothetical protein
MPCKFCERSFKGGQALGGHVGKAHKNESEDYSKKMQVRESRQDVREIL